MSAETIFDYHELTEFQKDVIKSANDRFPKQARNYMQRVGNAFAKEVKTGYDAKTKKKTGNLRRGVKRTKSFKYNGNEWQVRVYNKAPHAHLLEYGHRFRTIKRRGWKYTGQYVKGRHVVGAAAEAFPGTFNRMCEEFVDKFLQEGGF